MGKRTSGFLRRKGARQRESSRGRAYESQKDKLTPLGPGTKADPVAFLLGSIIIVMIFGALLALGLK